jgi:hypothetical protein
VNFKKLIFCIFLIIIGELLFSQSKEDSLFIVKTIVIDGDTIPTFAFDPIPIFAPITFKSKREERKYGKLKRYVVKVYPYAEVAGEMLRYFDDTLKTIKNEARRKKYLKKVEVELKEEFTGELKQLTILQGIILVKLIDRETGNTSYDLIKQLRGSFSAFLWQSLARLFGSNLKLEYDPEGDDVFIEDIVRQIELGLISYEKREKKTKL